MTHRHAACFLKMFTMPSDNPGPCFDPDPSGPANDPIADRPRVRPRVEVSNTQGYIRVVESDLEALAVRCLTNEGVGPASITIALVDNATIHRVNRRHLDHDWPTDVVTFALSDPGEPELTGELVVSAQMAAESALRSGHDPMAELTLYVVHGLLHLCGFDDTDPESAARMRRGESEHLAREGIDNPYLIGELAALDKWGGVRCRA